VRGARSALQVRVATSGSPGVQRRDRTSHAGQRTSHAGQRTSPERSLDPERQVDVGCLKRATFWECSICCAPSALSLRSFRDRPPRRALTTPSGVLGSHAVFSETAVSVAEGLDTHFLRSNSCQLSRVWSGLSVIRGLSPKFRGSILGKSGRERNGPR
jgi:hypothetical protein